MVVAGSAARGRGGAGGAGPGGVRSSQQPGKKKLGADGSPAHVTNVPARLSRFPRFTTLRGPLCTLGLRLCGFSGVCCQGRRARSSLQAVLGHLLPRSPWRGGTLERRDRPTRSRGRSAGPAQKPSRAPQRLCDKVPIQLWTHSRPPQPSPVVIPSISPSPLNLPELQFPSYEMGIRMAPAS